ncbi:hypothetical protein FSP39_010502, partial [Pinctada imbricata]
SSGYESETEASESDAENDVITEPPERGEPEKVMRYKSTNALCDHLKFILSMPELCDVTFLVGERRVPVHGVKAILGARSAVFYKIIMDSQRKFEQRDLPDGSSISKRRKLKIEVNKYKPEDFRYLMQFIHCGKVKIGNSNLPGLLCGAYQFALPDLKTACWDFVSYSVNNGNVSKLKESTMYYKDHGAGRKLLSKLTSGSEKSMLVKIEL